MRMLVHIGDQSPHGIDPDYDSYPDGCPDGHDALKIAHVLAKQGVAIYNVDCGYGDGLRQTFYHALSYLTNGVCVSIQDANTLSQIVVGATMEEETQNMLSLEVVKIYDDVVARHPHAREDQLVYEVHQRLIADGVRVKCVLGDHELGKYEKKQVECIAFCTDLAQVKAMQTKAGEYMDEIKASTKQIVSEGSRLVSERQVRTCLRRIGKTLAMKAFTEEGCSYATKKWRSRAFRTRWEPFKAVAESMNKFVPWKPVKSQDCLEVQRTLKRAGEMSKPKFSGGGVKATIRSVPKKMVSNKPATQQGPQRYVPPQQRSGNNQPTPPRPSNNAWQQPRRSAPVPAVQAPARAKGCTNAMQQPTRPAPVPAVQAPAQAQGSTNARRQPAQPATVPTISRRRSWGHVTDISFEPEAPVPAQVRSARPSYRQVAAPVTARTMHMQRRARPVQQPAPRPVYAPAQLPQRPALPPQRVSRRDTAKVFLNYTSFVEPKPSIPIRRSVEPKPSIPIRRSASSSGSNSRASSPERLGLPDADRSVLISFPIR